MTTATFRLLCVAGVVVSLAAGIGEAVHRPSIKVDSITRSRTGLVTVVKATVTNTSSHARCPTMRADARATDGTDLANVAAAQPAGPLGVAPHASATYTASMVLTGKQYAERLKDFAIYAQASKPCTAAQLASGAIAGASPAIVRTSTTPPQRSTDSTPGWLLALLILGGVGMVVVSMIRWPHTASFAGSSANSRPVGRRVGGVVVALAASAGLVLIPLTFSEASVYRLGVILIFVIAVLGLHILVNWAGQLSLAHAEVVGLPAFLVAKLSADHHMSPVLLLPIALILGTLLGAVVGLPSLRVSGFYVAIVTLAVGLAIDQFFFTKSWLIGTGNLTVATPTLGPLRFTTSRSLYPVTAIVFLGALLCVRTLYRSKTARSFLWVKVDEAAASANGINPGSSKILAYMIAGALAGTAGGLTAMWVQRVTANSFPTALSFTYLLIVVLAGPGSVAGVVAVAVLLNGSAGAGTGSGNALAEYLGPIALIVILTRYPSGLTGIGRNIMQRVQSQLDASRSAPPLSSANVSGGSVNGGRNGRLRSVTPLDGLATILIVAGFAAIALAWYHTGNTDQVWIQAQELASGGVGGIALVIVGVGLLIRGQMERNTARLADRLERLEAAVRTDAKADETSRTAGSNGAGRKSNGARTPARQASAQSEVRG